MPSLAAISDATSNAAARAFVRSLNILLKYSRLYGPEHQRTQSQSAVAWKELSGAHPAAGGNGLLVGVTGTQLLLDGVPLDAGTAEKSLAQLLNGAGVASIHFSREVGEEDLARLVRAFVEAAAKSANLSERLKNEFNSGAIKVSQVRFIQHEEGDVVAPMLAHLAAQSLGENASELQSWLQDPHKLLQMIAAAEGAGKAASGTNSEEVSASADGQAADAVVCACGMGDEIAALRAISMLAQFGGEGGNASGGAEAAKEKIAELPLDTQDALRAALVTFAGSADREPDRPMLLQLAEHLTIRFALERFERGDLRVNAVREMLDRMAREMESLRKVLNAREESMTRAGLTIEDHAEVLDRQFWAAMPEKGKRSVLLSPDAWCIPPRNIADYVTELLQRNQPEEAERVLSNYAGCIQSSEPEARLKTAHGLTQMAAMIGGFPQVLQQSMALAGEQLVHETDPEMQRSVSSCFVRLSQEAVGRRKYVAVQQALAAVDCVEQKLPELGAHLRSRLGLHDRLPEFIAEALRTAQPPADLLEMLRCVPQAAAEKCVRHFETCVRREDCERVIAVMQQLGPAALEYLRQQLTAELPEQAVLSVGLLSRLDPGLLERALPSRMRGWRGMYQDTAIRQLAAGASPARGNLLLKLLDYADPMLLPQLIDEIGISGDRGASARLMTLAFDEAGNENGSYLQLKAVEALGRLRELKAESHLRLMVEGRHLWSWKHPRELRVASAQSLVMIDPAAQPFLVSKGFSPRELALGPLPVLQGCSWSRQRRYPRFLRGDGISGKLSTSKQDSKLEVSSLSLGGGLGKSDSALADGVAGLELHAGLYRVRAQVWLREEKPKQFSFEITGIELDDRSRLRRLLAGESSLLPAGLLQNPIAQSLRALR